jgi:hypothetical protein
LHKSFLIGLYKKISSLILLFELVGNVASVGVQSYSFFREILPPLATATQSKSRKILLGKNLYGLGILAIFTCIGDFNKAWKFHSFGSPTNERSKGF